MTDSHPALTISRQLGSPGVEWDDYVRRAPGATFCHLAGWMRVLERTWGHQTHVLLAARGDTVVGVLPLVHVRGWPFGSMLVSIPNAIYGGVLADDAEVRRVLTADAKRLARQLNVDYLELRDAWDTAETTQDSDLRRKELYVTFDRPLVDDEQALLRSYPKKIRYIIRQASEHGLSSHIGKLELLDEFYDVFASNMRDLGTPVFPKRIFAEFLREFPDACDILIVRQGASVAGATLNFYFGDAVLPHFGCAYRRLRHTGASSFMYWQLMRSAAARGYTRFDFGRSKLGSGSYAFKRGWRMKERPLPYHYFLVRSARMPNLSPANPRYRRLIQAWRRLPLEVTKLVGPMIVRNIP